MPDHTDRLAGELSASFEVTVLTSPGVDTARGFAVSPTISNWHDGAALIRAIQNGARGGTVLWQYVPHMYGRGGANLTVPRVLRRLRGTIRRQMVLAHELYGPWSWLPHRAWYALAQRLMWRGLLRSADDIGISTDAWREREMARGADPRRLFLAPSPSNLPVHPVPDDHPARWRAEHGLGAAQRVLGFFGSPGAGKQFDWVLHAWREARRAEPATGLVIVGGRVGDRLSPEESAWCPPLGYLASEAASAALQAIDVLALPFVDGVSERRSSFMAGLAHGLPVVTRADIATGNDLRAMEAFVGVSGGQAEFTEAVVRLLADAPRRRFLGNRARETYEGVYAWPRLADRLRARMSVESAREPGDGPGSGPGS